MPLLGEYKVHTCCICHKLCVGKPHRLVHQEWSEKHQYQNKVNYDFCDECFKTFIKWIRKHKEEKR